MRSATVPADPVAEADEAAEAVEPADDEPAGEAADEVAPVETATDPTVEAAAADIAADDVGAEALDADDVALEVTLAAPPGPSELQAVATSARASIPTAAAHRPDDRPK
jgi:hypothetical protein